MNWLDIVLLIVLAGSVASSFARGFSREAVSFAAAVVALLVGIWFYGSVGNIFEPWVSSRGVANFLGFFVVFVGIVLLGGIVGLILRKVVKFAGLSWMDRILGASFGFVRGALVGVALVTALMAFTPGVKPGGAPQSVVRSRLAPYYIDAARVISALAPFELKQGVHKTYEQVKQVWRDSVEKRRASGASAGL